MFVHVCVLNSVLIRVLIVPVCLCTLMAHTRAPARRSLTKTQSNFYANSLFFDKTRLVGAKERRLKVWDLKTGGCLRTLRSHTSAITCVNMGDELVLTGDESGHVHVTHLPTGNCWRTLKAHDKPVVALQASARMMVSASIDSVKVGVFKWPAPLAAPATK